MKILRTTDRVRLTTKTEEPITVEISPLTNGQKIEISSKMRMVKGDEVPDFNSQATLCIKYCIKSIEGLTDYEGNEYKLEFDGEFLSESCADDLISVLAEAELILPMTLAANKSLKNIKNVEIEVVPKS